MSDTIIPPSAPVFNTQPQTLAVFYDLAALLWRGGEHAFYWTPNGPEFVTDDGQVAQRKVTTWCRPGRNPRPPASLLNDKNGYFGVYATAEKRETWQRSTNDTVAAVTCFYADLDGKDYVTEAEFLPFYVAPDLAGLSKAKARGALTRAQTAATEAAYKANPEEYKRRALDHLTTAPLPATAAWDSGGGYQAVWVLADPIAVTDENRAELRHYLREWVHKLGGDGSATDLARVLRIPGSHNCKKSRQRADGTYPLVTFLWCDLGRQYGYTDFLAILPPAEQPTKNERKRVHVPTGLPQDLGDLGDVPTLPHHPAIDNYNATTDLRTLLLELGYTDAGSGRMHRPGGCTAGVQLHQDNTASIYSSADPLYCEHRITPAHALAVYEHEGDPHKLLAALTGCPRPLPPMNDTMKWELLKWAQSKAARDLLRDEYGIRRPDGYLRTLEALIVLAAKRKTWCFVPGLRSISNTCNASHQSIAKHLTWLSGTLWQTWHTAHGAAVDLGLLYWLYFSRGYAKVDTSAEIDEGEGYAKVDSVGNLGMKDTVNLSVGEKNAKKGGGVNLSVALRFQHDHLANDAFVPVAYVHGMARRMETTVLLPSLGHAGRVAWAAMLAQPGITRQEIAEQSGVSQRTLEKTLRSMERMKLVTVTEDAYGEKGYRLQRRLVHRQHLKFVGTARQHRNVRRDSRRYEDESMRRLNDLLPEMTSYKTGTRRAELGEQSRAKWLYKQLRAAKSAGDRAVIQEKLRKCDDRQSQLRAELDAAGIRPAKGYPRKWLRWDTTEMQRDKLQLAQDLAAMDGTTVQKLRWAMLAGHTEREAMQAMRPSVIAQLPAMAAAGD